MTLKNIKILQNTKFKTAKFGCFFRLPLTRKNISLATLLSLYQSNVSEKYQTMYDFEHRLQELYDLDLTIMPQIRGNSIIYSFEFTFIEPQKIIDSSYTYEVIFNEFQEMLLEPLWNQDGQKIFAQTKEELLDEIDEYFDSPENIAYTEFFKTLYRDHPDFGTNVFGDPNLIKKINLRDLQEFHQKILAQPSTIIGQLNDVDVGEKFATQLIRSMPGNSLEFELKKIKVPLPKLRNEMVNQNFGGRQTQLFIGYGWLENLPAQKAMVPNLLVTYLGGDEYSVLFQKIREDFGAVYSIDALNYNFNNLLVISAGIQKEKLKEVIDAVQASITDLARGVVDNSIIQKAKQGLIRQRKMGQDQQKFLIQLELMNQLRPRKYDFDEVNELIMAITAQDLIDFAQQLFLIESYILD